MMRLDCGSSSMDVMMETMDAMAVVLATNKAYGDDRKLAAAPLSTYYGSAAMGHDSTNNNDDSPESCSVPDVANRMMVPLMIRNG